MTNVSLPMPEFLDAACDRIPSLAGLKFTNPDLMTFQQLLHLRNGRFDVLWGLDEFLLAAVALGAEGAVGATYNFAAPMYQRIIEAVKRCDLAAGRVDQFRSVELIALMVRFGFLASAKEAMRMRGLEMGPARLPNANMNETKAREFRAELERLGTGPLWG
jgi:N-acetylneuraminate lyase